MNYEKRITLRRIKTKFLKTKYENRFANPGIHDFIIVLDHLKPDFNIGKIFRSADFLGCNSIHLVGINYFDPCPAKGCFKHVPALFLDTIEDSFQILQEQNYEIMALDTTAKCSIFDQKFPKKCALIIGHEEFGLSFDPKKYPFVKLISIPGFGKSQSMNASIAASLAMYEWVRQNQITH